MIPSRYRHPPLAPTPGRILTGMLVMLGILTLGLADAAVAQETELYSDEDQTTSILRTDAETRAAAILATGYQTELPTGQPPERKERESNRPDRPQAVLPDILVKIVMIIGVVLLVIVGVNMFYSADRWIEDDSPLDTDQDDFGFGPLDLEDPDRLAAAGRYAEAIHVMLLRALALAAGRLNLTWPHSLTSREIMGSAALTDQARANLADLVTRVEIHHFGGQPPQEDDFRHCRVVFERLAADPIRVQS